MNLALHEGGHLLFGYLPGDFLGVAGGTLLQLAAPVLSAVMFYRQPDYFAIAVCGAWLATSLYNVAEYMADARTQELPLMTVGLTRVLAFVVMWTSMAAGGWLLWRMARARPGTS